MNVYRINRPCYPSVGEIMKAKRIFTEYIQQHAHEAREVPGSINYTSPEIIIDCALAKVWEAGRLYQAGLEVNA